MHADLVSFITDCRRIQPVCKYALRVSVKPHYSIVLLPVSEPFAPRNTHRPPPKAAPNLSFAPPLPLASPLSLPPSSPLPQMDPTSQQQQSLSQDAIMQSGVQCLRQDHTPPSPPPHILSPPCGGPPMNSNSGSATMLLCRLE